MNTKNILVITCLIALFTASAVSACTGPNCSGNSNNGLYSSREEAISALDSAQNSGTSNDAVFSELKSTNPDKKADLWSCAVSVYYADSSSGYKSIYQSGTTRTASLASGVIKESYKPGESNENISQSNESLGNNSNVSENEPQTVSGVSTSAQEINDPEYVDVHSAMGKMTTEQIKSELMDYFTGKEEVTFSGIQDLLNKCLPDGYILVKEDSV